ncbi:fibrinogen C domain-containing protein 1-like [Dysidea avara]|uniref:fibrinogen C domain-containing protein 1-like n=1 Tax=Dysidea avara TaxID=196820 RepID=UPI003320775F
MTTIITLVVLVSLGIVLADADGNDCIIRDNDPIENCCNLGFGHSKFSSVVNKPKVYDVKNFCGNCQSTLTKVYCDTLTAGGGWTVIQRRQDGSVDFFNRGWVEYEEGFGDLTGEFWYGLRSIHCLTSNGRWELRIDFMFANGTKSYLSYKQFSVGPAEDQYQLSISGFDSVGLTDPFSTHALNSMKFSSADRDNDLSARNCALGEGGWWLRSCSHIELNNDYNNTKVLLNSEWHDLPSVELKIRPLNCRLE